jgi:hypothetical protein
MPAVPDPAFLWEEAEHLHCCRPSGIGSGYSISTGKEAVLTKGQLPSAREIPRAAVRNAMTAAGSKSDPRGTTTDKTAKA